MLTDMVSVEDTTLFYDVLDAEAAIAWEDEGARLAAAPVPRVLSRVASSTLTNASLTLTSVT